MMKGENGVDSVLNCTGDGWLMTAGVVLIYGVLVLAGAALIKHLFVSDGSRVTG
jgi:hypothetical protein